MHQPWYLEPQTGEMVLPWVRLHGTKDYLDMAECLKEFPKVQAVINVTPCLLEQVELYGKGTKDRHQLLSRKPAQELTPSEGARLLEEGFLGNPERLIHPYPRYYELMAKKNRNQPFSTQELRDLQVWSNLSWMDPRWRRQIPEVSVLVEKGSHFTEEEKEALLNIQMDLLGKIIPTYRALQETGQVELSVSPWAHPILPLLGSTDTARQTNPGMPLPAQIFQYPEDVTWHLKMAVEEYVRWFGRSPKGLWPSEGGVSEAILPAIAQAGFSWMAADEELLWKSLSPLHGKGSRSCLYQPYRIQAAEQSLTLVFRDHVLSDLIGFVYSGWPEAQAVADFLSRLKAIEQTVPSGTTPPLVLVALDGENPWEFYSGDGEPFLRTLYQALSREESIRCTTISSYLEAYPPRAPLEALAPGSWIRGEFSTWIGHEPQNRAWEELSKVRRLIGPKGSRSVAIAEGSDWFWWLGPEHNSPQDPIFERLFRSHLKSAYQAAGRPPPATLEEPLKVGSVRPLVAPTGLITPVLDGEVTSYFEWLLAGEVDLTHTGSAMARAKPLFTRLWWGCDASNWYIRLDPAVPLSQMCAQLVIREKRFQVKLTLNRGTIRGSWSLAQDPSETPFPVGAKKVLELGLPLGPMKLAPGETIGITISVEQEGLILERYPEQGTWELPLPTLHAASQFWSA